MPDISWDLCQDSCHLPAFYKKMEHPAGRGMSLKFPESPLKEPLTGRLAVLRSAQASLCHASTPATLPSATPLHPHIQPHTNR